MAELFAAGGKRVRPALVLLGAQLGDYDFERAAPAAMAVELVHAATLIHDDVIDRAPTRRGRPTVFALKGEAPAIVVGDFYFAKAYREAARTGDPAVVELLAAAIMRVCHGELQQQQTRFKYRVTADRYFRRIELKTAALIAAACRMGGALGGLSPDRQAALGRFGRLLGMAFQVADDVLDYTASAEEVGKPVGHDIADGHVTLPLLIALGEPAGQRLKPLLVDGRQLAPEAVRAIVDGVREAGAPEAALARARDWTEEAKWELQPFEGDPAAEGLAELADYVVARSL